MRAFFFIILTAATLLTGCAKKIEALESRSVIATIKTPNLSVSQAGFISVLPNDKYRLQIYAAGQGALELTVGEKICQGALRCLSAGEFNKRYLSENYPPNLMRDVIAARAISNLENAVVIDSENGWTQNARSSGKYDVSYEKNGGATRFRDSLNKVLIVIRRAE
ncbi:MAG: hypothetical protein LBP89_08245 [Helicobacteraceae bacterium]|jgi:hypothetical protein|nr:hypothetical protein [Helicobacteraceae bacterium]